MKRLPSTLTDAKTGEVVDQGNLIRYHFEVLGYVDWTTDLGLDDATDAVRQQISANKDWDIMLRSYEVLE